MLKGANDPRQNEIYIGTNCLGLSLLYWLLLPILTKTATSSAPGRVRTRWAASTALHVNAAQPGGMRTDATGHPTPPEKLSSKG